MYHIRDTWFYRRYRLCSKFINSIIVGIFHLWQWPCNTPLNHLWILINSHMRQYTCNKHDAILNIYGNYHHTISAVTLILCFENCKLPSARRFLPHRPTANVPTCNSNDSDSCDSLIIARTILYRDRLPPCWLLIIAAVGNYQPPVKYQK